MATAMQLDGPQNTDASAFRPPPPPPSTEGVDQITAKWLQFCSNDEKWMPARQAFIEYLTAVQKAHWSSVNSKLTTSTNTLAKMASDIEAIKNTVNKRTTASSPGPTSFRDALLRASPPVKAQTPPYKHNEVVVKLNDPDAVQSTRNTTEAKLVAVVNDALKKNRIEVDVRSVSKLPSGDLAIQTRSAEDMKTIKTYNNWVKVLSNKANAVEKTYPVLVFTHKLQLLKKLAIVGMCANIAQWNNGLKPVYISPLHAEKMKENDAKGALIMVFRTKREANEAIDNGLVIDGQIHMARVYDRECRIKQCFNCYKYGHFSSQCTNKQVCGRCSHNHATPLRHKPQPECRDEYSDKCAGCGKQHPAWSKSCQLRLAEIQRIKIARNNVPTRYEEYGEEKTTTSPSEASPSLAVNVDSESSLQYKHTAAAPPRKRTKKSTDTALMPKANANANANIDSVRTRRQSKTAVAVYADEDEDENTMNTSAG